MITAFFVDGRGAFPFYFGIKILKPKEQKNLSSVPAPIPSAASDPLPEYTSPEDSKWVDLALEAIEKAERTAVTFN